MKRDPFNDATVEAVIAAIVHAPDADAAVARAREAAPSGLKHWVGGWMTVDRITSAMGYHGCSPGDPSISQILRGGLDERMGKA